MHSGQRSVTTRSGPGTDATGCESRRERRSYSRILLLIMGWNVNISFGFVISPQVWSRFSPVGAPSFGAIVWYAIAVRRPLLQGNWRPLQERRPSARLVVCHRGQETAPTRELVTIVGAPSFGAIGGTPSRSGDCSYRGIGDHCRSAVLRRDCVVRHRGQETAPTGELATTVGAPSSGAIRGAAPLLQYNSLLWFG
jgi:hypothetical protein